MQVWLKMLNYKSQIPNAEKKVSNAARKNVNTSIKLVRAWETINNVEENNTNVDPNIVNVKKENPTVTPPPSVRDSYKKEDVYHKHKEEEKLISKKPARKVPWVSLTVLLLAHCIIGFILTPVIPGAWAWAVVVAWAAAVAGAWAVAGAGAWAVAGALAAAGTLAAAVAGAWAVAGAGVVFLAGEGLEKSFNKFHSFLILAGTSNIGLGLGWIVYRLFKPV
jgi:serine/threonine-protein kinase